MKFEKINLNEWRQFSKIDIEFHPRMTIITGANGAGKTTILRLLSQHFGWDLNLLATPKIDSETGVLSYFSGLFRRFVEKRIDPHQNAIGEILYSSGQKSQIAIPDSVGVQYGLQIYNQAPVSGLHINSHRSIQNYQQISSIPTNAISAENAYGTYSSEIMQRFQGGYSQHSPMYRMKESIISMATFGPGNSNVQRNPALEKLYYEFKIVLSKVLPPSIGFIDLSVRIPDVVLVTKTGEFIIDAASGGLMSLIDLAWQIFLYSQNKEEYVVSIDEPENHLHPSMQRSLLSRLSDAFPKAQFIIATHSPFIVSSMKDSFVYALQYVSSSEDLEKKLITSTRLDLKQKAGTANEILRDVLGVPISMPEWAEAELNSIVVEFRDSEFSEELLNRFRGKLSASGLNDYFPEGLKILVGRHA